MGPCYDIAVRKHHDDLREAERRRQFRRPTDPHPWLARLGITAVLVLAVLS